VFVTTARAAVAALLSAACLTGCARGPRLLDSAERKVIDRSIVEYPNDLALTPYVGGLTAPVGIAFESQDGAYKDALLLAEGGKTPRVYGFKPDGEQFWIYPKTTQIPFFGDPFRLHGPIGGIALHKGLIYVSHRDETGMGVITVFDYEGKHSTVVADLPARGDYGVTDLAVHPTNGRLYFGVGAATNSGVVGLDNWDAGWVENYPDFADRPLTNLKLNGYRFTTPNPRGGLFGGDDIAVTAPLQAFGDSRQLRIPASPVSKPSAAVYSVNLEGGDLRVEAHGIRLARGLVFNEFGNLFVTNNGMELRGTRPVKDDPDVVLRVPLGGQIWYGWPDFSTDLSAISESRFQPPQQMIVRTGYPELASVLDHESSGLIAPDRNTLLRAVFAPLSGAAKMTFVPDNAASGFKPFAGSLVVTLYGDRAPFATSGHAMTGPQGYSVKRVDLDTKRVTDFVFNTRQLPAHLIKDKDRVSMERPIDAKFGPDGALYIVDYGYMELRNGEERVQSKTGRIYRLGPIPAPTTKPAPVEYLTGE